LNNTEKQYLSQVFELGCAICRRLGYGETPPHLHHMRSGVGKGQRATNYEVIPLCPFHHTGNGGIHGMGLRAFEREYGVTEVELVQETQLLAGYTKTL
jgi:hypothetical protein